MSKKSEKRSEKDKKAFIQEMVEETQKFYSQHRDLDSIIQDLSRRACKAKTNYPLVFISQEIFKIAGSELQNKELAELRKKVERFQMLLEHLRQRDGKSTAVMDDDEKVYQEYSAKHELRQHRVKLISMACMAEAENPLLSIAEYLHKQPDTKIILRREMEQLEKRAEISSLLIQRLINEKPMDLKEIEAFSTATVSKELSMKSSEPESK